MTEGGGKGGAGGEGLEEGERRGRGEWGRREGGGEEIPIFFWPAGKGGDKH